ncbi:MAG: serine protein kinase PrkA [Myxococcales bacterium]|nr:serine protein kinase PrkA [Myxococcales bacterium]
MTNDDRGPGAAELAKVAESVKRRYDEGRWVLSFDEYLELFAEDPVRHARDASRYVRDVFDHYGTTTVRHPWGEHTRYNLFDLPFEDAGGAGHADSIAARRAGLVGQEPVQEEMYRALSNFAREGRPNRLVLLHGPNGSAKSTLTGCILRALEHYSTLPEGALYTYSWVFPSSKTTRQTLGFGGGRDDGPRPQVKSYAHLADDELDAKLLVEVRDHPLFLVPIEERRALVTRLTEKAYPSGIPEPFADWFSRGRLCHKSQQIFDALLASYKGSYRDVLKHVRVERYFISHRYRTGAVTIGPQMSVDAAERQVTADRSLSALPASLQALSLYEAKGELVEAAGGVLEFSDLLKRPLDTFKYLQLSVETQEVSLTQQNVQLNCVMLGSANELHLDAFREHPEFPSFRGRLELVRTPYLRSHVHEKAIYDTHVAPQVQKHVAPHATAMAAEFAVLTRMKKADPENLPKALGAAALGLSAVEKMDLYATGKVPQRLDDDTAKVLRQGVRALFDESADSVAYEGRVGASPREMRVLLLDAAQSQAHACLSPLAVLKELEALCARKEEFEWLALDAKEGGYHDVKLFLAELRERLSSAWEHEMYAASGVVEEGRYEELFERYVQHVSVWVKRERIRNKVTGELEEPDENMMREVEKLLDLKGDAAEARRGVIGAIAAWAIDHPGEKIDPKVVFPGSIARMRDAVFAGKRGVIVKLVRDITTFVRDGGSGLDDARRAEVRGVLDRLASMFGYCDACAADAAASLAATRFA